MKGRLNGRMIRIFANPSPFEQVEAHLVETMFYDQWAPSGKAQYQNHEVPSYLNGKTSKVTQSLT